MSGLCHSPGPSLHSATGQWRDTFFLWAKLPPARSGDWDPLGQHKKRLSPQGPAGLLLALRAPHGQHGLPARPGHKLWLPLGLPGRREGDGCG